MGVTKVRLYEITDDIKHLTSLAESGELTLEQIADTLEDLESSFSDKAEAVIKVRQEMLSRVATIDNEIERLTNLRKSPGTNADRLEEYLKSSMIALGKDKMVLGLFAVTLRKSSKKLDKVDESKLPGRFFETIPASKKLDKRALLNAAKLEDIDGVTLGDSKRSLTIR